MTEGAGKMPTLLLLTQRLPYPPNKGEKIRQYHFLRHLTKSYKVYLGCLLDDQDDLPYIDHVRGLCEEVFAPVIDRRLAYISCLRGLLSGEALSVLFFRHSGLRDWCARIVTYAQPSAILIISSNMAPYVLEIKKNIPCIVDLVDVDSQKWKELSRTSSSLKRMIYRREAQVIQNLERSIIHACDYALFVSESEAAIMKKRVPRLHYKIRAIRNGVDYNYFDPHLRYECPFKDRTPHFVFTGTMSYPPNIDAVRWFSQEILPQIRRLTPDAKFYIVGNRPASTVKSLEAIAGVVVTGAVTDVRPYLAYASVVVAPMRIARGIQNKVLEGMAMGRPMVVTSSALEGIRATPGQDIILADSSLEFAVACVRLLGEEGKKVGVAARRTVERFYDWDVSLRELDLLIVSLLIDRESRPVTERISPD